MTEQGGFLGKIDNLRALYERYGGMLLGYLTETLQDIEEIARISEVKVVKSGNDSMTKHRTAETGSSL